MAEPDENIDRLLAALEAACGLIEEGVRSAETQEAERRAAAARLSEQQDELLARVSSFLGAGEEVPTFAPPDLDLNRVISRAHSVSLRWEESLGDASDQLMRLWADARFRATVEEVAGLLRDCRRLRARGPDNRAWRGERREKLGQELERLRAEAPEVLALPDDATQEDVAPLMRDMMRRSLDFMEDLAADLGRAHEATLDWYGSQREILARALTLARSLRSAVGP